MMYAGMEVKAKEIGSKNLELTRVDGKEFSTGEKTHIVFKTDVAYVETPAADPKKTEVPAADPKKTEVPAADPNATK